MSKSREFYINGQWVDRSNRLPHDIVNPATEQPVTTISLGSASDVDEAVAAARAAFASWSQTPNGVRFGLLRKLAAIYERRLDDMAAVISTEMGAPITLSKTAQAASGLSHLKAFLAELERYDFEYPLRPDQPNDHIICEPIGVCGLITPWNWPMNQVCLKVPPAISVGCTVVLKPSEMAPLSSLLFAEFVHEAGFPPGVFNLVNGDGATVGAALSRHADIDMISFTGSCRAGSAISKAAADTFKRVTLELGGKSPTLIFADTDVEAAAKRGARSCFINTGQSCDAPTRMLVERSVYDRAVAAAVQMAHEMPSGDPSVEGSHIGPLASKTQFNTVQRYIESGIREGARVATGGLGPPDGITKGWFVRPTVFTDVTPGMTILREEIFGPVLCIMPFDTEEQAITLANDTEYGLAAYIQSGDPERCRRVARRLRAGIVRLNGASRGPGSPFGGYKHSGNGREGGRLGIEDFLEVKAVAGWPV
jgi:aldehyde dehydrogenase (NAD+)